MFAREELQVGMSLTLELHLYMCSAFVGTSANLLVWMVWMGERESSRFADGSVAFENVRRPWGSFIFSYHDESQMAWMILHMHYIYIYIYM